MKTLTSTVFVWLIFLAYPLWAQDVEYVSSTLFTGGLRSVYTDGEFAYCISDRAFQVISIADSSSPQLMGGYPFDDLLNDFSVNGQYVYIAAYIAGLYIIDISDNLRPIHVSTFDDRQDGRSVSVMGDLAYLLAESGLFILDISDPLTPVIVGSCAISEYSTDIVLSDGYAYVADWYGGLKIIDISDPGNPTIIGSGETPWEAIAVFVDGSFAYVVDYFEDPPVQESGLRVFDVSDPSAPDPIGDFETYGDAHDVIIRENYAFVANGYRGLDILDVSDPTNPTLTGNFDTLGSVFGVSVSENFAYLAHGSGFFTIDITNPSDPLQTGNYRNCLKVSDVFVSDNYAYVASGLGLHVLNMEYPRYPTITGACINPAWGLEGRQVFASGDSAYVAAHFAAKIIDVSNRSNPVLAGSISPCHGGVSRGIFVDDRYLYKADGTGGLHIVDLDYPNESSSIFTPGCSWNVFVSGNFAYVADATFVTIVDVSDPHAPSLASYVTSPGTAWDVFVADGYAYVADRSYGLSIFDVSDPYVPTFTGGCNTLDDADGVKVSGNYAYVAANHEGLQVVDIADPYDPTLVSGFDTPRRAEDLFIYGDYIYVADYNSLLILRSVTTGIDDDAEPIPQIFSLSPNYPNPFNASTTIEYSLPQEAEVAIDIYDILGRRIETLVSGKQAAGSHLIKWEAGNTPSGVYFYRIKAGEYSQTQKCVLLK